MKGKDMKQYDEMERAILNCLIIEPDLFKNEQCLSIDDIRDLVNDKDEIRTSIKAKEYITGIINANWKRFDEQNYGECWGIRDEWTYTINAQILYRELQKGGFEFETIKKEWAEMGFLEKNSQGRFIHNTAVRKEKGNYIRLKL